jgi:VWFA-related protein
MTTPNRYAGRFLMAALLCLIALGSTVFGQQKPTPDSQTDDVLRINTELVQTGVTVLDKQGRFVDNLKPEQFELRVDGKPVPLQFFDRVAAWTAREEKQLAAAAKAAKPSATAPTPSGTTIRGRNIVFFVDDFHLSLDSLGKTRNALTHFIDSEMTPLDQVAFTSASGQIGFLQQFTDNKAVLRAALARLKPIPYTVRDTDQPPMTEYVAIRIMNGDRDAAELYIDKIIESYTSKKYGSTKAINRNAVYEMVKTRANQITYGVEAVAKNSLLSLENLLHVSQQVVGRKLVFFISDGFYLNTKNGNSAANSQLERVTDLATRSGSVIYTIDARGLFAPIADATGDRPFDPKGRLDSATAGESVLSQDGLSALAGDTGGRFLKNQNYFETWVSKMLDETSNYYLLAWRPPVDEHQKSERFKRVTVSIIGRPDLTVRLPSGFLTTEALTGTTRSNETKAPDSETVAPTGPAAKAAEVDLRSALGAPSARRGLPTQLSTSFVDVPSTGPVLTAAVQMATDVLGYGADGKGPAAIDVAGVVLNDQGKQAGTFKTRVNVNPLAAGRIVEHPGVIYSHKLPVKPGIYQVRVAARDDKSGLVGSAAQWIEIPDLGARRLTLSSLLVGGQFVGSAQKQAAGADASSAEQVQFSVDRRFKAGAHLNFLTIIYNATRGAGGGGAPELTAQIRISRDGQTIVTSPIRNLKIESTTDLARIPYGADIALQSLPAGHYILQVTINDKVAKTSEAQQVAFDIE